MEMRTLGHRFLALSPLRRRFLLIIADAILLPLAVWLSFWLRLADPASPLLQRSAWMLPAALFLGLPLYAFTGQYEGLTRYAGSAALYRLAGRNGLLVLLLAQLGLQLQLPLPPRSSWLLLWMLLTGLTGLLRFGLRDLLLELKVSTAPALTRVAIYGAGSAGAQLAASLRLAGTHQIVCFFDDNSELWRRTINGVQIHSLQHLPRWQSQLDQLLLAIPSLPRQRRRALITELQSQGLPVLQVPSLDEITSGRARVDALRPVAIEELLGRDPVPPDPSLLGPGIRGANVCVTGAGGSIGSELCRQILALEPRCLILLERSEPSLYAIEQELKGRLPDTVRLLPVLGSVDDSALLAKLFEREGVQRIFHAAAYKHVPLVEANPLAALANNVIATRILCRAAVDAGVELMLLVSTDKAVRPTNVMGASKRLAELVVQASAIDLNRACNHNSTALSTRFAMVRFGNVLGSSGSVVPLFRRQIAEGGPITLTHPEIIRYFMTIPEAAQLVLQAGVLANGGDLFLLDMGEPVLIRDLATQMVRLSGMTVRDSTNPTGDIEIVHTGLRAGEKLYEELLIHPQSEATVHPLIYRAIEQSIPPECLWPEIDALERAVRHKNIGEALNVLAELVPEWQRQA